jgi:tetratricopeptide (TPR) repeat protein
LTSRVGRKPEAIVALEKAARIEPRSSDPFYELGKLYEEQEDWPKARQALEHAIELNPQYAHAHYQLSRVYAHLGLTSKADQEAPQTRTLIDSQRNEAILKQRERAGSFQPQTTTTSSPNRE